MKECCGKIPVSSSFGYEWIIFCKQCKKLIQGKNKTDANKKWEAESAG